MSKSAARWLSKDLDRLEVTVDNPVVDHYWLEVAKLVEALAFLALAAEVEDTFNWWLSRMEAHLLAAFAIELGPFVGRQDDTAAGTLREGGDRLLWSDLEPFEIVKVE